MMTMMIFNNWWSPCKWMVCSALWLIYQISMNSTKATAPSQDFCGCKRCRYHSLFSFRDWLRIWRRLNCSPLKSLTCSCIDFSLYNRPWRRGFGKSVWGMENALFVNLRFVSDKRLDIVLSITLNAFSRTQELWIPSNHTHPCFLAFVIIAAIRKVR